VCQHRRLVSDAVHAPAARVATAEEALRQCGLHAGRQHERGCSVPVGAC